MRRGTRRGAVPEPEARAAIVTGASSGVGAERYGRILDQARAKAPLADLGAPEDVADAVAWLIEGGAWSPARRW